MVAANENHSSHLTTANPFRRNHAHTSNTGIDITTRWHWIINTQSSPFSQQTSTKNLKHLYWEQVEKYYLQAVNSRAHTNTPASLTTFTYFVESSRLSICTVNENTICDAHGHYKRFIKHTSASLWQIHCIYVTQMPIFWDLVIFVLTTDNRQNRSLCPLCMVNMLCSSIIKHLSCILYIVPTPSQSIVQLVDA